MKNVFLILALFSVFLVSGCASDIDDLNSEIEELQYRIEELESENYDLEQENEELKEKLDNINSIVSDRNYDYNVLLDDIEDISLY